MTHHRTGRRRTALAGSLTGLLIAAVFLGGPASPVYAGPAEDRQRVQILSETGTPSIRAAAAKALSGTDTDIAAFLETGLPAAQELDDALLTAQISSVGGPHVRAAAQKAMLGTAKDIREFLETGQHVARELDDRETIRAAMAAGSDTLKREGQKVLDTGDWAALRSFVTTMLPRLKVQDDRIATARTLSWGGPEVVKAANAALNSADDAAALREYVATGQHVAREKDDRAEIAELVKAEPAMRASAEQALAGGTGTIRAYVERYHRIQVNRVLAAGGPEVRTAAQKALDEDTDRAYVVFLREGQHEARKRDKAAGWKPPTPAPAPVVTEPTRKPAPPEPAKNTTPAKEAQPARELAKTGVDAVSIAGTGALTLAAGVGLLVATRRRRSA
ncbi:ALF repeat-containing protein [Longispora albida]|uniref:ALF repeat-containing protein n=1 Tax=Longispora albida TaxID=203523 RepID=UPI00035D31E2|nr:ALF repeat-containing protein [Longispora albida]